jgi:hypothetical protein
MKKLFIFLIFLIAAIGINAQDATYSVTGRSVLKINTDYTITGTDSCWFLIKSYDEDYPRTQYYQCNLFSPSAEIHTTIATSLWGRVLSTDSWTQISSTDTWTTGGTDTIQTVTINNTSANRYREYRVLFIGNGSGDISYITDQYLKLWFAGTLSDGVATLSAGTITGLTGLQMGTTTTAQEVTLTDASRIGEQINLVSSANPSGEITLMGLYAKTANITNNQANLQLVGIGSRVSMGKNALDAYGLQSHISLIDGAESSGNMTAISGKSMIYDDNASGIISAGLYTLEGFVSGTHGAVPRAPSTVYGLWVDIVDVTATAGLVISKYGTGSATNDIVLQNGETINNATNGLISIGASNFRAATYNFADATAVGGTGDAITINFSPDLTITTGTKITFKSEAANTTATTINVDGGGALAVEEYAGGTQNALDANDIVNTQIVEVVYNGTLWVMTSDH